MTGIGAIFDLYNSFHESKREKKKEEEEKAKAEEESVIEQGYEDEESDWHYIIAKKDWDTTLDMLQNYDFQKYKEKKPRKGPPDKRLKAVGYAIWVKEKIVPKPPPPPPPQSPLLALNELGETPLHAAVRLLAPDRYIVRMIFSERRATLIQNSNGELPLHQACLYNRNIPVIDRLIRANFKHMQTTNNNGETPLMVAMNNAIALQEEDGGNKAKANESNWNIWGYWGIPRSKEEAEWQERQEMIWSKVRFILLSYSTRRKILVDDERECVLMVLEHAAPPAVVEVTILAAQGMLHRDPTLAASALAIFMKREYPIKNLQLLLHHFPEQNYESMEGARKILSDHYRIGCRVLPKRTLKYREEMEKHALEDNFKRSLMCQEWWDKVRCLLRLRGHANNKEDKKAFKNEFLLHAALSNSDTAPSLVQLLMVMNPESIKLPHPFNHSLLIHLICKNWKYNLYPQSKKVGIETEEMEEPPMEQVLKIIVASDPTLVRKRYRDDQRLPIHHAIATSKSVDFLEALLKVDLNKSLGKRDPISKLYPFQMAALGNQNKNAGNWAAAKYTKEEWYDLSIEERAKAVDDVRNEQDCDQLSTIYFLLRKSPQAVTSGAELRKPASFRDTKGKGMVSTHCLMMMYSRDSDNNNEDGENKDINKSSKSLKSKGENNTFILQKDKLSLLLQAIADKEIPEELEVWFAKLKFWIRYCYDDDNRGFELPSEDKYLLHAAVSNEDTPPIIIELLLAIYPQSVALPVDESEMVFPLHLAASTPRYKRQPFEVHQGKSIFELLLQANPDAATIKSAGGLPVDIAQASGHYTEDEIEPLLQAAMRQFVMDMDDGPPRAGGGLARREDDESYFDGNAKPGLEELSTSGGSASEFSDVTDPPMDC